MDSVVRHRAWIVMGVVLIVVILAVALPVGRKHSATGVGSPRVSFGSQVRQPGATGRLAYTNGWIATSGRESVGVYAGRDTSNPRNGLFVIRRQSGGHPKLASVLVRGSGAVTLLRPASPATEQAAFGETLHFVTANGGSGTLDLSGDSVKLSG